MAIINEKRVAQHIRNFERALEGYAYQEPLSRYLTRFFKENKQMGSSDRKMTSRFIYNYFRLGLSFQEVSVLDKLVYAEFLCEIESPLVAIHNPGLNEHIGESQSFKIKLLQDQFDFDTNSVFPFLDHLSLSIDNERFISSHFVQPDLFIRLKRGEESKMLSTLQQSGSHINILSKNTIALPNGFKLQDYPKLVGKYEVQDWSSQQTIDYMDTEAKSSWWDACAASGGKALMFLDKNPSVKLLVSDIRLSILKNLNDRFEKAKINIPFRQKIIDLTKDTSDILGNEKFDGIILDVPCSGSGTWGRTPEMIQQFSIEKLTYFSELQKQIASNVIKHLKAGSPLVYMTCSVFSDENENVVQYLVENFGMEVEKMDIIKGYNDKADSMFAARLIKK